MKHLLMFMYCLFPIWCWAHTYQVGIIGDSISVPYPIDPSAAYYNFLKQDLQQQGYKINILNYSVGGSTTDTLFPRFEQMVNKQVPDVLIITLGVNDGFAGKSKEELHANINKTLEKAKDLNIPVLIGSVDISGLGWNGKEYSSNFAHFYEAWKQDPAIILFPFIKVTYTIDPSYFTTDRFHPNAKGHREIADTLKPLLLSLLEKNKNLHE